MFSLRLAVIVRKALIKIETLIIVRAFVGNIRYLRWINIVTRSANIMCDLKESCVGKINFFKE